MSLRRHRRHAPRHASLAFASLLLGGASCDRAAIDLGGDYELSALRPALLNPNIDVLFVIDDTGTMKGRLSQVAGLVDQALVDILEQSISQQPNLHIGVITTDMGCGNNQGDDGQLQAAPGCLADEVPYIVDVDDGLGGRVSNAVGSISDSLACLTSVGTEGCGFEAPLAAVTRAMERMTNDDAGGFLRDDALLFVVVLTDEDDCSVDGDGAGLFDTNGEPFGLRDSFRCFEYGTSCDQEAAALGDKTGCVASSTDRLVRPIEPTLDALVAAKGGDRHKVFVSLITGGAWPIRVETQDDASNNPGWWTLAPSCSSTVDGELVPAYPAPRLRDFARLLPGQAWEESICLDDLGPAVERSSRAVGDIAGQRACLHGALIDVDPDAGGLQPSCRATAVLGEAPPVEVPPCADATQGAACFTLEHDVDACAHTGAALRAELHPGDRPELAEATVAYACLTATSVAR
jgi:hypothetical protein